MTERTTLSVSPEVWYEIKLRKTLGESVDDVLRRVLELPQKKETQ